MSIRFNADEVFEMAERIERNGAKWYRKVADSAKDDAVRKLLRDLASMEDDHEKRFAKMRSEVTKAEAAPVVFDPAGEATLYLQAMADGYVFDLRADPSEKLRGDESLEEILKTAISLETDSILFYLGLRDTLGEGLGRGRVDDIIREEMGHINVLTERLREATA